MKKITISLIFIAFATNAMSQNDTTFYFKNKEIKISEKDGELQVSINSDTLSAEDKLYQGSYETEGEDFGNHVFSFSKFTKSKKKNKFRAHMNGLFAGFSNLASRNLSEIGTKENAELKLSSFEIGLTVFGMNVQLSKKYGWLFFYGTGFKVQQYNADRNYAFVKQNSITVQQHPEAGILYSKSRLVQWYLYMPIMIEYQKKISKKSTFFVQAGSELGLKLSSKSSIVYRNDFHKRVRENLGKGMNVNPLTIDAKVEIGFNDFGLYARYGLIELFRKNRGPEVVPVAAGVVWYL